MVALFVVATIIVFFVIDYFVQRAEKRKAALSPAVKVLAKPRFVIPKAYFFGKGHTWVELLPDGLTRVGLDDFVQKILGAVDQVTVVSQDGRFARGEKLFTVRQGTKTLSFRAPISGKVVAVNDELIHFPDMLRKEPYKAGWIAVMEPSDLADEIKQLSIGSEAAKWLKDEIKRFRNFITAQMGTLAGSGSPALAGATLMDGGVPVDDVMEHSPQEVWKKFENDFLASADSATSIKS